MIRFVDSFGHYSDATSLGLKWGSTGGSFIASVFGSGGRNNGPYCRISNSSVWRLLNFTTPQTVWITGWASLGAASQVLIGANVYGSPFTTDSSIDSRYYVEWGITGWTLQTTPAGSLTISVTGFYETSGLWQNPATWTSPPFSYQSVPLNPALWYYFEVKTFVDPAHGNQISVEVRVNGVVCLALTAVPGPAAPGSFWPALHTIAPSLVSGNDYSDFVVVDDTGTHNTSYLGDVRVVAQLPASDGFHQDWTPLTAGTHFSEVDSPSPPGDTSYVSSSTPGDMDSYGYPTPPTSSQVFGVQVNLWARKSDAGGRSVEALARLSSTDELSAPQTLSTNYGDFMSIFETDPSGAAWTTASLTSAEFGVKLSA
jgi:hypothetical protein